MRALRIDMVLGSLLSSKLPDGSRAAATVLDGPAGVKTVK
jgi:hypothetical protein